MNLLKTSCEKFDHCKDIKIDNIVSTWYGLKNIPISEKFTTNIIDKIEKYKSKPIQKYTDIYFIEKSTNFILSSYIIPLHITWT